MLKIPLIEQEIWRLKNKDLKPKPKNKSVPPDYIDTPLDQKNLKDDRIFRLASESAAEEAELEFNSLLEQFRDWKKTHKGTFKDFLKDNREKIKVIQISERLKIPPWERPEDYEEDEIIEEEPRIRVAAKGGRVGLQSGGNGGIRKIPTREFMQMSMRERVETLYGIKVRPSDTVLDIMERIADLPIIVEID